MKVTINRNLCGHTPAGCEACFGEFLRHGAAPDRGCITDVLDDGKPEVIATIYSGKYNTTLTIPPQDFEKVMYDGWMKYADLPPEAYDILPPHGDDIRRMLKEQK